MKPNKSAFTVLKGGNDVAVHVETFLLAAFTLALVGAIFIEVICRYLLFISTAWSEELARYLFVWLTYIGSAYAFNQGSHIEIDVCKQVIEKTKVVKNKELGLKILEIMSIISTILFLVIFCNIFWGYMMKIWASNQTSPTMHIPMGVIYLPVFIGSVMSIYHGVYLLYACLVNKPHTENA